MRKSFVLTATFAAALSAAVSATASEELSISETDIQSVAVAAAASKPIFDEYHNQIQGLIEAGEHEEAGELIESIQPKINEAIEQAGMDPQRYMAILHGATEEEHKAISKAIKAELDK